MREILTLQFGHYSNYIGTHWWNIQETGFDYSNPGPSEIEHDVLFREGITNKREVTYTPRLLLVDLKDSLNTLPEQGELYEPPVFDPTKLKVDWKKTEKLQTHQSLEKSEEHKVAYNEFQKDLRDPQKTANEILNKNYDFESQVKTWSDFLYSRFHPRTVNVVKEYQHCNENTPFDVFSVGAELWKTHTFEEEFTEKIRNYVEESDCLQGFQMLTDCTNAFSGFSASCLEYIRDEYERKSVLVIPSIPSNFADNYQSSEDLELSKKNQAILNDSTRVLNMALAFEKYNEYSSLFVPLCTSKDGWRRPGEMIQFHHTKYNDTLPYHSSAILASALDTVTLPYRLRSSSYSLSDFCLHFNRNGRSAAAASICLPFSLNQDADFIDCLDNWEGPLSKSITPRCTIGSDRHLQHITLRGIPETRLKKLPKKAGKQLDMAAYKCETVKDMLEFYLSCTTFATANRVTVVGRGLSTRTPFPNIFDSSVGKSGAICSNKREETTRVANVPVLAGIHSGAGVGEMLESLHTESRKLRISRFPQFQISKEEHEECLDNLFELREKYEDKYHL